MKFSFFHSWFLSSKYSESFFSGLAFFLGTTMGTPESNKAESTPALPRDLTQGVFPRITLNYPSVWIKFLSFFIWIWGLGMAYSSQNCSQHYGRSSRGMSWSPLFWPPGSDMSLWRHLTAIVTRCRWAVLHCWHISVCPPDHLYGSFRHLVTIE